MIECLKGFLIALHRLGMGFKNIAAKIIKICWYGLF